MSPCPKRAGTGAHIRAAIAEPQGRHEVLMSDSGTKKVVKCPLCEGRGELEDDEMLNRLSEKDLGRKLSSYVENIVIADEKAAGSTDFQGRVDAWNCTHFLWRRSPKE
jgi:hypothetical protein